MAYVCGELSLALKRAENIKKEYLKAMAPVILEIEEVKRTFKSEFIALKTSKSSSVAAYKADYEKKNPGKTAYMSDCEEFTKFKAVENAINNIANSAEYLVKVFNKNKTEEQPSGSSGSSGSSNPESQEVDNIDNSQHKRLAEDDINSSPKRRDNQ